MNKEIIKKLPLFDYTLLTLGSAIMAMGIGIFLVDAKVVPGGVSGLSMAIHYLTGNTVPVGMLMWILNVPLFIWGIKELGKRFGLRTFYSFTLNSIFIDLFRGDFPGLSFISLNDSEAIVSLLKNDFLFHILIGAVLLGSGLGIVFKFRGTTAGSDIVASIMQKRLGVKPGQALMFIDFFVISFAGIIIYTMDLGGDKHAFVLTLYAFFLLFVSSRIIDVVMDGFDYARVAFIISDKYDEISDVIMNDISRGATAIKTRGLYKNIEREVIMTVVTLKEVTRLTELIKSIDKDAFIIISNVHEVLGSGFRRRF